MLLACKGISVVLLEMHKDFDREFCGDTVHPSKPLQAGVVPLAALAEVQRRREWPTRVIQGLQTQAQKLVVAAALRSREMIEIPWYVRAFVRIPYLRDLPPRLIAFGLHRVRLES